MQDLTLFKEDLRRKLPLSRVVGPEVRLQRTGPNSFKGLCPFHKEKTPSFHVYDDRGQYHCFGCNVHGDAISYVEILENLTFMEALERLAAMAGMTMPKIRSKAEDHKSQDQLKALYDIHEAAAVFFETQLLGSDGTQARTYLNHRKITDQTQKFFRLGYAPRGTKLIEYLKKKGFNDQVLLLSGLALRDESKGIYPRFRGRLMFPIANRMGKIIAFGGRILGDGEPKYLNSPETPLFHKGQELYNHHQARARDRKYPLIVCEGYMDVIALDHIPGIRPVATLGTAFTDDHANLLWRLAEQPILCFDGDLAGQKAAHKALLRILPLLKPGLSFSFLTLPQGLDPADFWERGDVKAFQDLLQSPLSLFDYLWQEMVLSQTNINPEQQAHTEKNLKETLATITDKSLRSHAEAWAKQQLSQYFWQQRRQATTFKNPKKEPKKGIQGAIPRMNTHEMQSQMILAYALNYPQLVIDFDEKFFSLDFYSQSMDAVKEEIMTFCVAKDLLDEQALHHHLINQGYQEVLDQILCEAVYLHCPLAKPGQSYEEVKKVWDNLITHSAWQNQKTDDMTLYRKNLTTTLTTETWQKVKKLREAIQTHESKLFGKEP